MATSTQYDAVQLGGSSSPMLMTSISEGNETWLPDDPLLDARDEWLGVELRHLAAVNAVATTGSFRAAAERLGYVQSSISQQIAQLERLVGRRLFERSRGSGGVELTEAGRRLLAHSHVIMGRIRAARIDLDSLSDGASLPVRLALGPGVATKLLPRILPAFKQSWPEAAISTTDAATDATLFRLVNDGDVDLAFADLPLEPGPFVARSLLRDPYVLVVPRGSPLAQLRRTPTWSEIAAVPLAGHKQARYLASAEAAIRAEGLEPMFAYRSDFDTAVQAMVGVVGAAAIMTRLIADQRNERTELIDLTPLISPRVVALIWHRERELPPAVHGFRDVAAQVCQLLRGGAGRTRPAAVARDADEPRILRQAR